MSWTAWTTNPDMSEYILDTSQYLTLSRETLVDMGVSPVALRQNTMLSTKGKTNKNSVIGFVESVAEDGTCTVITSGVIEVAALDWYRSTGNPDGLIASMAYVMRDNGRLTPWAFPDRAIGIAQSAARMHLTGRTAGIDLEPEIRDALDSVEADGWWVQQMGRSVAISRPAPVLLQGIEPGAHLVATDALEEGRSGSIKLAQDILNAARQRWAVLLFDDGSPVSAALVTCRDEADARQIFEDSRARYGLANGEGWTDGG